MTTFIKFPLPTGKVVYINPDHIVAVRTHYTNPARCFVSLSNDAEDWQDIAMSQEDVMDTLGRAQDIKIWGVG